MIQWLAQECPRQIWFRSIILSLAFLLLILIFSSNPIRLKSELKLEATNIEHPQQETDSAESTRLAAKKDELIKTEHQKAIDEIKMLADKIDTWFHYKFILIGGLLALFLGHFGIFGRQNITSPKPSDKALESSFMSIRTSIMLALVCIVAFIIDMHIRTNLTGMQQLGQWIYNYVEPSYFTEYGSRTGYIPRAALTQIGFVPWETFLRSDVRQSMHNNPLYKASFSTQLHFITIVVYMIYLMVFQNLCLLGKKGRGRQLALIGFLSVHISSLAFIIVSHTVPDSFEIRCFPAFSADCWISGSQGSSYYLLAWLFLLLLSLPYIYQMFSGVRGGTGAFASKDEPGSS